MRFITSEYVFSHGHEPRGRGSWAFDFGGIKLPHDQGRIFWARETTYSDAKRQARVAGRALGLERSWEVKVLP